VFPNPKPLAGGKRRKKERRNGRKADRERRGQKVFERPPLPPPEINFHVWRCRTALVRGQIGIRCSEMFLQRDVDAADAAVGDTVGL